MAAIILSGGNNKRMLCNKALLQVGRKTIIEREIETLSTLFSKIIVVTNTLESHKHLGVSLVSDLIPGKGPLGGIYSGLIASKDKYNFVVGCDLPFLNAALISHLIEMTNGYDIVVPKLGEFMQPLYAVYSNHCLIPIQRQLSRNELRIKCLFDKVKMRYIGQDDVKKYDPKGIAFFNVNTEDDLKKARSIAEN